MSRVTPRRPSGFVEYLPNQQVVLQSMLDTIRSVYETYGFLPIETPALELKEVLLAKGGGETEKEVYQFSKGSKDYAMHYDLTVPLARYVAEHENELTFPFKRYQMQKVWRAERAQKGRFREFYQCDADVIGSYSAAHDGELLALICDTFRALDIGAFTVRLSNRKLLGGLLESIGLAQSSTDIFRAIDKLEKIGSDEVIKLLKTAGCSSDEASLILNFVNITGANSEILKKLHGFNIKNDIYTKGLEEINQVLDVATQLGVPAESYIIDLRIIRGLDYYTGTVYETVLNNHPEFGSVCSGGRYDDLCKYYTKTSLPGVGVSIGLTRLFSALLEHNIVTTTGNLDVVYIVNHGSGARDWALKVASDMRASGLKTQVDFEERDMASQLKYANKLGMRHVIVIGENEASEKKVTLKNMQSGDQELLAVDTAINHIAT